MNIGSYGSSFNYSAYGTLLNKAKTFTVPTAIPEQKPKSTNSNTVSNTSNDPFKVKAYDPFKDMAATGTVSVPSWVYTKTELTRSEDEIKKDMIELAKKHAKNGTSQLHDYEFQSLMKEYISPASPDRESILRNAVSEINEKIKISNSHKNKGKKEDFDQINNFDQIGKLLEMLGGEEYVKGKSKTTSGSSGTRFSTSASNGIAKGMPGGEFNMIGINYDACVENGEVNFAHIKDNSGEVVMIFSSIHSPGQLSVTMSGTEKEGKRSAELLKVYNEAYKEEVNSKGSVSGNFINETA
ncbi:MAG: hypothetical protein FWC15_08375 [Fibromonadales bacterium]|nr:hypothetical protein [Fibromonadales bacterium]